MTFFKEFPTMIAGKFPLRIYNEIVTYPDRANTTFWYFGFPDHLIDPIKLLLGPSCYWDENFDKLEDGFYLIYGMVTGDEFKDVTEKLQSKLDFYLRMYNMCLNTMKNMAEKASN